MKEEGKTSKAPLTESFADWSNGKIVLLALLGLTAGQGVVWYTGQFYALFFLTAQLKVDATAAQLMIGAVAAARHAVLHRLRHAVGQDRPQAHHHGRLPAGRADLLPALSRADRRRQSRALAAAQAKNKVVVRADPAHCSFQGSPIAREIDFKSSCDIAKRFLAQSSVSYDNDRRAGRHAGDDHLRRQVDERAGGHRRQPEVRRRQQRQGSPPSRRRPAPTSRRPATRPRPSRSSS